MIRAIFESLALICGLIILGTLEGLLIALGGHWLSNVFARAGATEEPSTWIAYIVALAVIVLAQISVWQHIEDGWS